MRTIDQIDLTKATTAEGNKQRKQTKMTTTANSTNILPAISRSISHTEIAAATFIGQFTDLSAQLHELGAEWDYTSVYTYYETMYDISGTTKDGEFRINVVCVMPQY